MWKYLDGVNKTYLHETERVIKKGLSCSVNGEDCMGLTTQAAMAGHTLDNVQQGLYTSLHSTEWALYGKEVLSWGVVELAPVGVPHWGTHALPQTRRRRLQGTTTWLLGKPQKTWNSKRALWYSEFHIMTDKIFLGPAYQGGPKTLHLNFSSQSSRYVVEVK